MNYRSNLLGALETYLLSHRFQCLPHRSQYRRASASGFHSIVLSVGEATPAIAEVQLGIRVEIAEQLAYQFTAGPGDYASHSTTLLVPTGRLLGEPYRRYVLERPADAQQVAQEIVELIKSNGLAFFRHYDHVAVLEELFNGPVTPWLPHLWHRSLRGIILAKLAQRLDWASLVTRYREQLLAVGAPPSRVEKYDQLAAYLRHFSLN